MQRNIYELINELKSQKEVSGILVKDLAEKYPQEMIESLIKKMKHYSTKIALQQNKVVLYKKDENVFEYNAILYLLSYNKEDRIYTNTKTLELAIKNLDLTLEEKNQLLDLIGVNRDYVFEISDIQIGNPNKIDEFVECSSFKEAQEKLKMFYHNSFNIPNQGYDKVYIEFNVYDNIKKENYEFSVRMDISKNINDFNPFVNDIKDYLTSSIIFDNYKEKEALKKAINLKDLEKTISIIYDENNKKRRDYLTIKPTLNNSIVILKEGKKYNLNQILEEYKDATQKEQIKNEFITLIKILKENLKSDIIENDSYYQLRNYVDRVNKIIEDIGEEQDSYKKVELVEFKNTDLDKIIHNLDLDIEEFKNTKDYYIDTLQDILELTQNLKKEVNELELLQKTIEEIDLQDSEVDLGVSGIGE